MPNRNDPWLVVHFGEYHDPTDSFGPGIYGWRALCDNRPLDDYSQDHTTDLNKTTCPGCLKKLRRKGLDLAKAARQRLKQLDPLHEL